MLLVPTYIAPSRIEGVGVFAAEPIAKGARIWKLNPDFDRLVPSDTLSELDPVMQAFIERYSYPLLSDPRLLVVELDNGRFMNHSERPNTRFNDPDAGFAIEDIAAGEEILCNYGEFDPGFEILPGRQFLEVNGVSWSERPAA